MRRAARYDRAMTAAGEPRLAPPGAGLPPLERWIAKYWLLPKFFRAHPWGRIPGEFAASGARVLEAYARVPAARRAERTLVARLRGLEDSSRFWSAAMVLEHLVIAGELITLGVETLARGETPAEAASIARIKPPGEMAPAAAEAAFREFLARGEARIRAAKDTKSRATIAHPWFGAMTARQWAGFPILHHAIHRRQLGEIAKGME